MPEHETASSSRKFMFRFTQEEVAEMENLLKENNNASPSTKVFNALAVKFSKTRHQQGKTYVRYDSVQNWFRKRRHMIRKAKKASLSSMKTSKLTDSSFEAEMEASEDKLKNNDCQASCKRNSEGGNLGEGTSTLIVPVSNSGEIVDRTDVFSQRENLLHSHVSALDVLHQAKATLEKLPGISMVDFKSYRRDYDAAICIIVENGFLSDTKKAELLLHKEQVYKIVNENAHAREELSKCNAFREKLTEAAESANKLMKMADFLEEKYIKIPQEMCTVSCKISELESGLVLAKAELEIMRGNRYEVAGRLAELSDALELANKQYMSLKSEEGDMIKIRDRTEERLDKITEEWVQFTRLRGYTDHEGEL